MSKIGVFILNKETDERLGILEFDPTGVLVASVVKHGPHPFALKQFVSLLDQPLYKKHADVISRDKALPRDLLITESQALAAQINGESRTLAGVQILAKSAEFT
jgi:hypothetical protein